MLELKHLSFTVNEGKNTKHILSDINLSINDKKTVVITGPNGGGKSTLAKIIMGIEKPSSEKYFLTIKILLIGVLPNVPIMVSVLLFNSLFVSRELV